VESAFYKEAKFLSQSMGCLFVSVVSEYKKSRENISVTDFTGPIELDFSVFNMLFFELYKTKKIPSPDHRQLVSNIPTIYETILKEDVGRVQKIPKSGYQASSEKCKKIVFHLVDLLYNLYQLEKKKEKFKFEKIKLETKAKETTKAKLVFEKNNICDSDYLVEEIYRW
jgi:hypothetical protein